MEKKPEGIPVTFEGQVAYEHTPPEKQAHRRVQPEKVLLHYGRLEKIRLGAKLGPVTLHLHLANACNHICPWCEPAPYRLAHLTNVPPQAAAELVEQAAELDVKSILLTGGGEPTANPYCGEFIRQAHHAGIALSMNTNAGLLHRKEKHFDLLRNGIMAGAFSRGAIRITLDAFDSETHRMYHKKEGDWDAVNENIRFCAQNTPTNIGILIYTETPADVWDRAVSAGIVPVRQYDREAMAEYIANRIQKWAEWGVRMVQIRPVYGSAEENVKVKRAWVLWDEIFKLAGAFLDKKHNILNWYQNHLDGVHFARQWKACNMIHLQSTLGANGDAFVCCAMKIKYGKWYLPDGRCVWKDIWLDEARTKLKIDVFKPECARCSQSAYNDVLYNVGQYASELL